jgi:hypothetical protein
MNDRGFFDLAMKVIAGRATVAERAALDDLLAREPALRTELARLQGDVRLSKEALALVDATQARSAELPEYARERLQTKVRQTLGRSQKADKSGRNQVLLQKWAWLLGLAAATAVILLVALPLSRSSKSPVIELAMLDTTGGTRGTDTNDVALLETVTKGARVRIFSSANELRMWEQTWPADGGRPEAKIIYDRAAAEMKVFYRSNGKTFERAFSVEKNLGDTLEQVNRFLHSHPPS